jgi:tRNA nucleotidyltransferase (CCA-adding enzyme)
MKGVDHLDIIKRLCDHEHDTYLVGGGIRDMLFGNEPKDFDVVTAASPEQIMELFSDCTVKEVGKSFGVILVDGYEVATFRHDRYSSGMGDEAQKVFFASSIQEDLGRRDFTINAMAYCELTGEIVDIHDGRADLKKRVIRFVGDPLERIQEDPNRIIRACRFLAKLEGEFDLQTRSALERYAHYVRDYVAPERIRLEILKAMELPKPSLFFSALYSIDVLKYIFPSMEGCIEHPHGKYHLEDVFVHLMLAGDSIDTDDPILRLAMYLHDIGKPTAYLEQGDGSFIHHENIGQELAAVELNALKFSKAEIVRVQNLIHVHMRNISDISDKAMRRLLKRLNEKNVLIEDFIKLRVADRAANRKKEPVHGEEIERWKAHVDRIQNESVPLDTRSLPISGGELMRTLQLEPGPIIGELQRYLVGRLVEVGEGINSKEELLKIANKYLQNREVE